MKNNNNKPTAARRPAAQPRFHPSRAREHHWGGDGTVGIPDSIRTILRITGTIAPATTLGNLYSYQFRGNSCYDPDYTGTGAQPTYFDNYMNMYNSYVVLSSKLRLEVINVTSNNNPVLVGAYPAYNTSLGTTALDCASMRYASALSSVNSGNAVKSTLSLSMSTAQQFGIPEEAVITDDLYSGTGTSSPAAAQTWYWTVFAQAEAGTSTLSGVIRWTIDYDVKFFDPVVANLSATRGLTAQAPSGSSAAASPALQSSSVPSARCPEIACRCALRTAGEFTP